MTHNTISHRSELLMPAGSLSKLKTAILYGADAVYAGTPDLSLRTQSSFTLEELLEGVRFAHERGKRIYLTLNLFTHNRDVEKLPEFVKTVRTRGSRRGDRFGPRRVSLSARTRPGIGAACFDPGQCVFVADRANSGRTQGAELCVLGREVCFDELS